MNCPICKKKIKDHQIYRGSHGTEEEYATCKDEYHFYMYEFIYGGYREIINSEEFAGSHNDSDERTKLVELNRDIALREACRSYEQKQPLELSNEGEGRQHK